MELQNPSEVLDGKPYGHHDPSRPPAKLPHPPAGEPNEGGDEIDPTRQAGIHAIEMYCPRHAVKASVLEKAHGVDGKYTQGLMMHEFCGTGEDEDPVSIALTVTSRLMYKYNVKFEEVGMLYVGSESLIDRSKSIKSNLMMLWNEHNCFDVEGTDTYNACYGGTAALLNCTNWTTSQAWDGRWAIACATDIADSPEGYRFMTGCSTVAMLVGVDAPLVFERERCSHIINRWDFYKPWGWHVMAPIVDGPGSIDVYYECLDGCQRGLKEKRGISNVIEDSGVPPRPSPALAAARLLPPPGCIEAVAARAHAHPCCARPAAQTSASSTWARAPSSSSTPSSGASRTRWDGTRPRMGGAKSTTAGWQSTRRRPSSTTRWRRRCGWRRASGRSTRWRRTPTSPR